MAGLIGLTAADIDIQDALQAPRWAYEGVWIPHPVVRLTTTLPIAVNADDGEREVVRARWGFPLLQRTGNGLADSVHDRRPMGLKPDKAEASLGRTAHETQRESTLTNQTNEDVFAIHEAA